MSRINSRVISLERVIKPPKVEPLSPGQERWIQFFMAHPKWKDLWAQVRTRWPTERINITEVFNHPEFRAPFESIDDEFWAQEHASRRAKGVACDCRSFDHAYCNHTDAKTPLW